MSEKGGKLRHSAITGSGRGFSAAISRRGLSWFSRRGEFSDEVDLPPELHRNPRTRRHMAPRYRRLLPRETAPYRVKLQACILRRLYRPTECLPHKRWHLNSALLHIQHDGSAAGQRRRSLRLGLPGRLARRLRRRDYFPQACLDHGTCASNRGRSRTRLRRFARTGVHFRRLQRLSRVIGSIVIQILIVDFGLRQQQAMLGIKRQVVRNMQILKHLLRYAAKHRSRNLSALMQADGRVEDHGYDDLRVVQWSKTREGGVVLRL